MEIIAIVITTKKPSNKFEAEAMRDEHCHVVFDVDDGSRGLDESVQMLSAARESGITEIVCTPHMRWDDFNQQKVEANFRALIEHPASAGLQLTLGYEVFYKTLLKKGLDQAHNFVTAGTSTLLLEFNTGGAVVEGWEHAFYELQTTYGLDLTIAHPERYSTVWEDFSTVYQLKDLGCRIQISAGDLFGNRKVAKCTKRILKEGLCDAIVSDAHRPGHYESYRKAIRKFGKYLVG